MSLYADEDLTTTSNQLLPSSSTSNANAEAGPSDPLAALASALTLPAESSAQSDALLKAGKRFEEHPESLPELCGQLLPMVVDGGESLLRDWTLDMVQLAVGRSSLAGEIKLGVAQSSLDALNRLLNTGSISTIKAVIPIFSTIHPILFRLLATSRPPQAIYDLFMKSKTRIISLALDPTSRPQNVGVKAAAWKFVQKVLISGTRAAAADPRLQKQTSSEPGVNLINRDSPLNASELEEEAILLRNQLVSQLFTLSEPALLHPLFQLIPTLCKSRPTLAPAFITSLTSWTPTALEAKSVPAMSIRSVEKTLRMVMAHLLKHPPLSSFAAQLNDALFRQKARLESAWAIEQEARRQKKLMAIPEPSIPSDQVLGKHGLPEEMKAESSAQAAKRSRYDVQAGSGKGKGPEVDVSTFQFEVVLDVVMDALREAPAELMRDAFELARRNLVEGNADAIPLLASALDISQIPKGEVKEEEDEDEVLNPLEMDLDEDEELLLAEDEDLDEPITFAEFAIPPPVPLNPGERDEVIQGIIERIRQNGSKMSELPDEIREESDGLREIVQPKEVWMLLLARMSTRGGGGDLGLLQGMTDFITADFGSRSKFASIWLNEEWYTEKLQRSSPPLYPTHLDAILSSYLPKLDSKDKSLSTFITSLPELPRSVIDRLESLCEDAERSIVGFLALRDLVETRPPIREHALKTLLQLCTHSDRKIRVLAISTVRRWVPDSPMSLTVVNYALGVLRRLTLKDDSAEEKMDVEGEGEAKDKRELEEGEQPEETIESKFLPPVPSPDNVQQHVELCFALSRRSQDLLDDIFRIYPKLSIDIQNSVETLLTPLIQSLGPTEKLVNILKGFPEGADKLILKTLTVLSSEGSTGVVRDIVRGLMESRDLDPRFIIPIIGTLEKGEIEKQVPRIVSLLTEPDNRDLVRTAFASLIQKLTPSDLLVVLHQSFDPSALKPTIEAIGICFSMTTVFRFDVIGTALSKIADFTDLPVIFMRTVIQAVNTYKSLVPSVANGILPKLVNKKIWQFPQLWEGFIRLVKLIAPASFGVLLQLPKEWLRDVIDKQPGLKVGLKGFLGSKPQARSVLVEIFGDDL